MDLGDRMKIYEKIPCTSLMTKTPVIMRIDGKAFHTYTRDMERPYDVRLHNAMVATTKYLVENIQGAQIGYTQSDEISILITDWENRDTQSWFNSKIQKMVSVSASMATAAFNEQMPDRGFALFDSRVYNLPMHDVNNYFIWRQQDASRNSVQMVGRAYFSHNELHGKNNSNIQDMLMEQHNINWNDFDTWKKRGTCVRSEMHPIIGDTPEQDMLRRRFVVDEEIPIFTKDRDYIGKYLAGL